MHGCSVKKLILFFLICLFLTGCATTGRGKGTEPSLPGFIPGGCSAYLSGKVAVLPDIFRKIFADNGVPDRVIDSTDRIYCCFFTPDRLTVFLEGDYRNLHARTYFNMNKRYEKRSENGFDFYVDQETGSGICLPGKSLIIYTEDDMQKLLSEYNPESCLVSELDGLYTQDIFIFRENPSIPDLKLKRDYRIFLRAECAGGFYNIDSDLCFSIDKDAKVASPVVKLFVQNLIKKTDIGDFNRGKPVSVQDSSVLIRGVQVPVDKGSAVFDYFISELNER